MKNKSVRAIFIFITVLMFTLLCGCSSRQTLNNENVKNAEVAVTTVTPLSQSTKTTEPSLKISTQDSKSKETLKVSYIDVDQGDAIFIELPNGQNMLIDAGTNATGDNVVNYLKNKKIDTIDYVVGTHPHEDHIGGLDLAIKSFKIGKVYMPKVMNETKTFEDVLDAIEHKKLKIITAKDGVSILADGKLSINIIAPCSGQYEEINNYSAVVKIVYGETSFLFMGDAEELSENQITGDVSADVLKVGHHGSTSSTSKEFLKKVSPSIAVISCGKDNKYGHPHDETVKKLNTQGAKILRTDELGTIVIDSDGKNIVVSNDVSVPKISNNDTTKTPDKKLEASDKAAKNEQKITDNKDVTYVLNKKTKKIHYSTCSSANKIDKQNKGTTNDYNSAISDGYVPCKNCNPK